eukprot:14661067-Ditylum_brightwellii.AAC.1
MPGIPATEHGRSKVDPMPSKPKNPKVEIKPRFSEPIKSEPVTDKLRDPDPIMPRKQPSGQSEQCKQLILTKEPSVETTRSSN